MSPDDAIPRQEHLSRIADVTSRRALAVWRRGTAAATTVDAAWDAVRAPVVAAVTAGQLQAASGATGYVDEMAAADGVAVDGGSLIPDSLVGVDGSGRTLEGLLYQAVVASQLALQGGAGLAGAFTAGAVSLAIWAHTAVLDTGRSADLTAATSKTYTHYIRVVSSGACSRCAILAGISSGREAFQRHPRCRCTARPVTETDARQVRGKFASPSDYFGSLSAGEQDQIFTKAGAEAIRAGADPVSVVSARRGAVKAYTDENGAIVHANGHLVRTVIGRDRNGTPVLGYTTSEGTTRRGDFGRRQQLVGGARRVRLMPETIIGLTDDPELRQILLRDAGYLNYPLTAEDVHAPLGGGFAARRAAIARQDRTEVDRFYRSHGITLGV